MAPILPSPTTARSLSSLTTLASNPPTYPRNPAQEVLEPLVLYIIRVPGSKDIFLTTLKPREQTVTAEDVQSCLYYLHVSSDNDSTILQAYNSEKEQEGDHVEAERANVHRKPLPSRPELELGDRPLPPPKIYPHYQPPAQGEDGESQVKRKALRGEYVRFSSEEGRGEVVRKPLLGPRNMPSHDRGGSVDADARRGRADFEYPRVDGDERARRWTALPGSREDARATRSEEVAGSIGLGGGWGDLGRPELDLRNNMLNGSGEDSPPPLPRRPLLSISPERHRYGDASEEPPPPLPTRQTTDPFAGSSVEIQGFHITIIRRDPSSGNQWNVGTISNISANSREGYDPRAVNVEISTPGYRRFLVDKMPSLPSGFSLPNTINTPPLPFNLSPNTTESTSAPKATSFHRTVLLAQPHQASPTRSSPFHRRQQASDSSAEMSYSQLSPASRRVPHRQNSRANYSFLSPWNGTCTFSTGLNGRSLKCRHVLPTALAGDGISPAVTVCEIRFNLPLSSAAGSSAGSNSKLNASSTRAKIAKHIKHPSSSLVSKHNSSRAHRLSQSGITNDDEPSSSSDDEDRMDLTLGREKAGGGWKGKSAKLGKLVVEDEGLKMCDLVVGSAMGVWWVYYCGTAGNG